MSTGSKFCADTNSAQEQWRECPCIPGSFGPFPVARVPEAGKFLKEKGVFGPKFWSPGA